MSVPVWKRNKSKIQYVYDAILINKEINKLMINFVNKMNRKHKKAMRLCEKIFYQVYSNPIKCAFNAQLWLKNCSDICVENKENINKRIELLSKAMGEYSVLMFSLDILHSYYRSYIKMKTFERILMMIRTEHDQLKKLIRFNKKLSKEINN